MNKPTRLAPLAIAGLLLMATGCDLFGTDNGSEPTLVTTGVVVANGGNFSTQNGSISVYDVDAQTTSMLPTADAFVQSLALHDGRAYAAGNTFSKGFVAEYSLEGGTRTGTLAGDLLDSPRGIAIVNDTLAYVSSLSFSGDDGVVIFDIRTGATVKRIPTDYAPEQIAVVGQRAYVGIGGFGAGRNLVVIDTETHEATGSIDTGCDGPSSVLAAGENVLVGCTGNTVFNDDFTEVLSETNGQIVLLSSDGTEIERRQLEEQLGASGGGQYGAYSETAQEGYFIASGSGTVYRYSAARGTLEALSLPDTPALTGAAGIGYDAESERMYTTRLPVVAGAPSFEAQATLVAYDRDMTAVASALVGPGPTHIALAQEVQE